MKNMTICEAQALILQEIMHLFNYEPARSFTDFRTTAECKHIQHLPDQN